ncbi:unnamed protein product, partial [Vitis vinifera]
MCGELEIVDQPGKEEGELSPFTRYNTNLRIDYLNSGNENHKSSYDKTRTYSISPRISLFPSLHRRSRNRLIIKFHVRTIVHCHL